MQAIGKGTRKLLRRWRNGRQPIKVRQVELLKSLGLIEWVSGNVPGGGYVCGPVLTAKGAAVLEGKEVAS